MTGRDVPDLTVAELEQIREATLRAYEGGDEQYDTLPPHLLKVVEGDGGLVNMIDLAIERTRQLDALRAQTQQDYAAIYAKQLRDRERITELEARAAILPDSTFREAIARARQRRENPNE